MKKSKSGIVISVWIGLGIAVILFFLIFSFCIGGSAMNGYSEAGRFFVADHGNTTEVSKAIWTVSKVSGILFWVFLPLTPLGGFAISEIFRKIERKKSRVE